MMAYGPGEVTGTGQALVGEWPGITPNAMDAEGNEPRQSAAYRLLHGYTRYARPTLDSFCKVVICSPSLTVSKIRTILPGVSYHRQSFGAASSPLVLKPPLF